MLLYSAHLSASGRDSTTCCPLLWVGTRRRRVRSPTHARTSTTRYPRSTLDPALSLFWSLAPFALLHRPPADLHFCTDIATGRPPSSTHSSIQPSTLPTTLSSTLPSPFPVPGPPFQAMPFESVLCTLQSPMSPCQRVPLSPRELRHEHLCTGRRPIPTVARPYLHSIPYPLSPIRHPPASFARATSSPRAIQA
jgi:hypothetical protein